MKRKTEQIIQESRLNPEEIKAFGDILRGWPASPWDTRTGPGRVRHLVVLFLWLTGCRSVEAQRLRCRHVTFSERGGKLVAYFQIHGKGNKFRTVPIIGDGAEQFRAYLENRRPGGTSPEAPLFPGFRKAQKKVRGKCRPAVNTDPPSGSEFVHPERYYSGKAHPRAGEVREGFDGMKGTPISRTTISAAVAEAGDLAGITRQSNRENVHRSTKAKELNGAGRLRTKFREVSIRPHILRHTRLSMLAESGATQPILMAAAGHSKPETTAIYLRLNPAALVDIYDQSTGGE